MEIEPEELRLKEAFDYIKSIYFKSWDKNGEWLIELIPNLAIESIIVPCSKIEKSQKSPKFQTITLHSIPKSQTELYSLIIHLIAHAVSENDHEMPWLLQMLKAVKIAKKMKEPELVALILKDIQPYRSVVENNVYRSIISFLLEHPFSSYDSVLKKVAIDFKCSPSAISKEFKSCRTIYIAGKTGAKMRNKRNK